MAANCDGAGTVTAIFQEACLELTDLLVCVCVFVHTAASSDCNVGGMVAWWLVLSHPKTFFLRNSTDKQVEAEVVYW